MIVVDRKVDARHHTPWRMVAEDSRVGRVMVCQSKPRTRDTRTLQVSEHTSSRRVEEHAGRAKLGWSLGAVKDANLPTFGIEDL
jgi:hypothetical protein